MLKLYNNAKLNIDISDVESEHFSGDEEES